MKLRLLPLLVAALFTLAACASAKREPKAPGAHDRHHHENHR